MPSTKTKAEEQKTLDIAKILKQFRVARFKSALVYMADSGYWQPLNEDYFRIQAYKVLGVLAKSRFNEVWDFMQYGTPDLTKYSQYIRMGDLVWDTRAVDFTQDVVAEDCVFATKYTPELEPKMSEFVLDIATRDELIYATIMQTIAPIFMAYKPAGVIWWKGNGRNGKTTLAQVIYDMFPGFIANLTIKQIEDERDAPVLNGNLANIVKESSDGYIEDSKAYKSIGTHEDFPVHKFHSQQSVTIDGSLHHIFSANNIPTFADKSDGARRRTLIIPFEARFPDDPTFIDKTFTKEFYEQHLGLFVKWAKQLKEWDYHYHFDDHTQAVKERYDIGTNSATTYLDELATQYIFGFNTYGNLFTDYQNWCIDNGYVALSTAYLRRATEDYDFHSTTVRGEEAQLIKRYVKKGYTFDELELVGGMHLGLYRQVNAPDDYAQTVPAKSNLQELLDAIPD
jgi:phage/plasmid-associated DNA primase